jgi:hypothetical protein
MVTGYRSLAPLAKFQMAPTRSTLMSSGFKKKEPRYLCLSEARASHSHKICTEISSSVPHFLQVGSLLSPITCRCLLRVLCPVSRPITALDCVLLKDNADEVKREAGTNYWGRRPAGRTWPDYVAYVCVFLASIIICWAATAQSVQRLAKSWMVRGSNPGGGDIFHTRPRPALVPMQPPVQWVPGLSRR